MPKYKFVRLIMLLEQLVTSFMIEELVNMVTEQVATICQHVWNKAYKRVWHAECYCDL